MQNETTEKHRRPRRARECEVTAKIYACPVIPRVFKGAPTTLLGFVCPCGRASLSLAGGVDRICPVCGKHLRAYYPTTPNDTVLVGGAK